MPRTTIPILRSLAIWLVAAALPTIAVAQGTASTSHTVRRGDTLWALARQYLSDPFLWPEIFRLNTTVVEDPHWIYPGEVLRLVPGEGIAAVPSVDTPLAPDTVVAFEGPTMSADTVAVDAAEPADDSDLQFLSAKSRSNASEQETFRHYIDKVYRPLRISEFYSSGFLTEGQKLPFGTFLGPVTPPQIRSIGNRTTATLYTEVAVRPPAGATYQVGDSLLIVQVEKEIPSRGRVVEPTGLARIIAVTDGRYVASVVAVYGAIRRDQFVLPAEPFRDGGSARAVAVANGVEAAVAGWPGRQELKAPQNVLFLTAGRTDGVSVGDLFEVRRTPMTLPDGTMTIAEPMAVVQVVHVRDHSATARILTVRSPDIPAGTRVRQIAKLPS